MLPCALNAYRQTCSHRGNDFDQSIIRSYVELNQVLVGRDIAQWFLARTSPNSQLSTMATKVIWCNAQMAKRN